jgi:hypothetical protein
VSRHAKRREEVHDTRQYVVLNDVQFPFEDKAVLWDLVVPFIRELKPYGVVLNGDVVDNHEISDFAKNPRWRKHDLKSERRCAVKLFEAIAPVTRERWYIEGNHEDRYRRYAWEKAPDFERAGALRTFAEYFKLDDFGFQHRPYGGHIRLGKLMVTHGLLVAKDSATSAQAALRAAGDVSADRPHPPRWRVPQDERRRRPRRLRKRVPLPTQRPGLRPIS